MAYDPGDGLTDRPAIYARSNLTSGRSFVVILGSDEPCSNNIRIHRIRRILQSRPDAHAFRIVAALQKWHAAKLHSQRCNLEEGTLMLESQSGIYCGWNAGCGNARFSFQDSAYAAKLQICGSALAWGADHALRARRRIRKHDAHGSHVFHFEKPNSVS